MTNSDILPSTFTNEIDTIFNKQVNNKSHVALTTAKERIAKLKKLRSAILGTFNDQLKKAVYADLRKHEVEANLNEILPAVGAINFAIKNLRRWMRDEPVDTPLNLWGFSHRVKYEPKGIVFIIAPWNFPITLSLKPLISAIASGNCIMLKPSEHTPETSKVLNKMISHLFSKDEIAVVEGGIPETTYLLKKPFNHIFFTGAPSIGKIVMRAAAEHLCSVSLELGGKSPTIIDKSANLDRAVKRIAWAKNMNNGQVCIAPDYIMIHESMKQEFIDKYKKCVSEVYGDDQQKSDSYGRIVNARHAKRLVSYLDDAIAKGAKVMMGGKYDIENNYFSPTVISDIPDGALLWEEEIFGPILPIRTFKNISETIDYVNNDEKPLALYIYSKNKKNINRVINETSSGAAVINYSNTHYTNPNLPFGGVNNSGIGKGNGYYGFKAFSNAKAIQKHWSGSIDLLKLIRPPYTDKKVKLSTFLAKYFA